MNQHPSVGGATPPTTIVTPHSAPKADPLLRAYDLPCALTLEVPAINFTVGSLMALTVGAIIRTAAQQNEDLWLKVNGQRVGLVEFDVIGYNLAVRLTGVA